MGSKVFLACDSIVHYVTIIIFDFVLPIWVVYAYFRVSPSMCMVMTTVSRLIFQLLLSSIDGWFDNGPPKNKTLNTLHISMDFTFKILLYSLCFIPLENHVRHSWNANLTIFIVVWIIRNLRFSDSKTKCLCFFPFQCVFFTFFPRSLLYFFSFVFAFLFCSSIANNWYAWLFISIYIFEMVSFLSVLLETLN